MGTETSQLKPVRAALAAGDVARAEQIARMMPPSFEKGRALLEIAERSDRVGLLDEAAEAMGEETPPWKRAELLSTLAKAWLRVGNPGRATASWNKAILAARRGESDADPANRALGSVALGMIAVDLSRSGETSRALDIAATIADPAIRSRTIASV